MMIMRLEWHGGEQPRTLPFQETNQTVFVLVAQRRIGRGKLVGPRSHRATQGEETQIQHDNKRKG